MIHGDLSMYFNLQVLIGSIFPSLVLPEKDHHKIWPVKDYFVDFLRESGYFHIQATKPDTIGKCIVFKF